MKINKIGSMNEVVLNNSSKNDSNSKKNKSKEFEKVFKKKLDQQRKK